MHCTIVISGSVAVTQDGVTTTRSAGDIIDLGTTPHSVTALEPAVIINITKNNVLVADTAKQNITNKISELDAIAEMANSMKLSLSNLLVR